MPLILFSFAFNPETKELTYIANIRPPEAQLPMALRILQDALISQARLSKKAAKKAVAKAEK